MGAIARQVLQVKRKNSTNCNPPEAKLTVEGFGTVEVPDGKRLVTVGEDNTTRVWDTQTGREVLCVRDGAARRASLADGGKLLLTLGDQGFSGIDSTQAFSQDPNAEYGKTILIDLTTREHHVFSVGHRNPQGVYKAADGRVWLTEHGPQGGDELNLLRENGNFGWPEVTYGTDYGITAWPRSKTPGRHSDSR